MNVVIYARYSSDKQTEQSIEGQLRDCHSFCERLGYHVVDEYVDQARSASKDLKKRVSFLRMIEESSSGRFNAVVVYKLDRFSRDKLDNALMKRHLAKNGVRVLSATEPNIDGPEAVLIESILEGHAAFYSLELAQKVRRGMRETAFKFKNTGGLPALGYKLDSEKRLVIDEEKAPIVLKIFEMYANGQTMMQIADYMNERNIKTSQGGSFKKNSFSTIFRNGRYIGYYTFKGEGFAGGVPAIVPEDIFYKVQERLGDNRKNPSRGRAREEYLLTNKLFCGYCNDSMTGSTGTSRLGKAYSYYICNAVKKKQCQKRTVRKDCIEERIAVECCKVLTEENINKIVRQIEELCHNDATNSELDILRKSLAKSEKSKSNLMESLKDCDDKETRKELMAENTKVSLVD